MLPGGGGGDKVGDYLPTLGFVVLFLIPLGIRLSCLSETFLAS